MSTTPKENILKKIRKALAQPVPLPFPQSEGTQSVFQLPSDDLAVLFAAEFTRLQGRFAICANESELSEQLCQLVKNRNWKEIYCVEEDLRNKLTQNGFPGFTSGSLADCDAAITSCEALVARTGSMVLSAAGESGRTTSVYAPVHICIAHTSQLVYDIKDALLILREKYQEQLPSLISFATGPSRTADIEKTLVVGVHGPGEVFCFLVDS